MWAEKGKALRGEAKGFSVGLRESERTLDDLICEFLLDMDWGRRALALLPGWEVAAGAGGAL